MMKTDTPVSAVKSEKAQGISGRERPILFSGAMVRAILRGEKTQTRRVVKPVRGQVDMLNSSVYYPTGQVVTGLQQQPGAFMEFRYHGQRDESSSFLVPCPYGASEDRLWVREEHFRFGHWEQVPGVKTRTGMQKLRFVAVTEEVRYRDNLPEVFRDGLENPGKGRPVVNHWHARRGRFMARQYSRITLEVVKVRVERLQEISEEDAIAEGVEALHRHPGEKTFWKNYRFKTAHPRRGVTVTDEEHRIHSYRDMVGGTKFAGQVGAIRSYQSLWESINGVDSWTENPWVWVVEFRRVVGTSGREA
jgi:hypothetical protein